MNTIKETEEILYQIQKLTESIKETLEDSREKSIALTKLQECELWLKTLVKE